MFHLLYLLLVGPLFLKFMLPVHCCPCLVSVRWGEGIKYSHIEVGLLKSTPPQTPLADTSSLAPCWLLADAPLSWLEVTGCKSGSTQTSLHTSVSKEAVMSWISLCLRDRKAALRTGEYMLYIEAVTTFTFGR